MYLTILFFLFLVVIIISICSILLLLKTGFVSVWGLTAYS